MQKGVNKAVEKLGAVIKHCITEYSSLSFSLAAPTLGFFSRGGWGVSPFILALWCGLTDGSVAVAVVVVRCGAVS